MEHTKTPYQRITINGGVTIVDKYGSMVAKMNRMYDNNSDTANDIVKACNNYNALVDNLRAILAILKDILNTSKGTACYVSDAEQALEQAE